MKALLFPAIAATLALGACQTASNRVVFTAPGQLLVNRTLVVASGSTTRVQFAAAINPDCTSAQDLVVRVTQDAAAGKLVVKRTQDFPSFRLGNPRSACNKQRVPGTLVEYRAPAGFVGADSFSYEEFLPSGGQIQFVVAVKVL